MNKEELILKIIELREKGVIYKEIAKRTGSTYSMVKYYCQKEDVNFQRITKYTPLDETEIAKRIEDKFPQFKYIGGYTGIDGYMNLQCNDCGCVFTRSGQYLKSSYKKMVICPNCLDIEKKKKEELAKLEILENIKQKEKDRLERLKQREEERKDKIKTKICEECGKEYQTTRNRSRCCSKQCANKFVNRCKDKRIYKNGKPDLSITLTKLIKRDKNICHICGCKCNSEDYYYKENIFIAGEEYPSIDHVNPIAKGGTHTWDNVKLAHRGCNSEKRDKLVYVTNDEQLKFSI